MRHDIQFGGQTYWTGYEWKEQPQEEQPATSRAPRRSGELGHDDRESVEMRLWRSFQAADTSGDGKLSRREFFVALDSQGALLGRQAEWAHALRQFDTNQDSFIEWDEFREFGKRHPEIIDMMRDLRAWTPPRAENLPGASRGLGPLA